MDGLLIVSEVLKDVLLCSPVNIVNNPLLFLLLYLINLQVLGQIGNEMHGFNPDASGQVIGRKCKQLVTYLISKLPDKDHFVFLTLLFFDLLTFLKLRLQNGLDISDSDVLFLHCSADIHFLFCVRLIILL